MNNELQRPLHTRAIMINEQFTFQISKIQQNTKKDIVHPKKPALGPKAPIPHGSQIHVVQEMQIRVGTPRSSYMRTARPLKSKAISQPHPGGSLATH